MPIRYGILSTARIAQNQHIPSFQGAADAELLAISSRTQARADEIASQYGIPRAYGTYEALLADPDIDAVIVATPNSLHHKWALAAARAGKHILCEKPLATSVAEADEMIAGAAEHGVLLMEGFTPRFNPQDAVVRRWIDEGAIGDIVVVRAELTYTIRDWDTDSRTRADLAGGALMDAGCYCVNQIRFIMGSEPLTAQAMQRSRLGPEVDTTFCGLLRFPGDRLAYLLTSMEEPFRAACEVIGTAGRVDIPSVFGGEQVTLTSAEGETTETFAPINRFTAQLDHFSACIQTGAPLRLPPQDGRANTAALVALKRAALEGGTVAVER